MRVCILSMPLQNNYGCLLQAYALQNVLISMGHDVVTVKDYPNYRKPIYKRFRIFIADILYGSFDKKKSIVSQNMDRFITSHINTITLFNGKHIPIVVNINDFDSFVVGSDQVWRPKYVTNIFTYFLDFINDNSIRKIAYAASFGLNNVEEYSSEQKTRCKYLANQFAAISVREDSGVTICKNEFGIDVEHVLDPTLLLNVDKYINLIESSDEVLRGNLLISYVLDCNSHVEQITKFIEDRLSLKCVKLMPEGVINRKTKNIYKLVYPSVSNWIAGFRDAKFVITDSFHGTVFSIIFNKPFIVINNYKRGNARFDSLLSMFNLKHRLVSSISEITDEMLDEMDFTEINSTLKLWKEKSFQYLQNSLG